MNELFVETLIIGSGFSGRTVASFLKDGSYLIAERGERRSHTEFLKLYEKYKDPKKLYWENADHAYKSNIQFNKTYNLSGSVNVFSKFEFIEGGSSNRWDGNAVRIPSYIFDEKNQYLLNWPFEYEKIKPYYELIENRFNLCGDYHPLNPGVPKVKINTADRIRSQFETVDFSIYLRNQAKNPIRSYGNQNTCMGTGVCEICPMDAKLRPDSIYPGMKIRNKTLVESINFDKDVATSINCVDESQKRFRIGFKNLVIAAHAVESARLIWNSKRELPSNVNVDSVGCYYQDHAHANIIVRAPFKAIKDSMPFKASFEIKELSRIIDGIDVRVAFTSRNPWLTREEFKPWVESLQHKDGSLEMMKAEHEMLFDFSLTFEMPPDKNCRIDYSGVKPSLIFNRYQDLVRRFDKIYSGHILPDLRKRGFEVVAFRPHYRYVIGQHHLVGTLNMAEGKEAVVGSDFKVIGTENVFVAGTSLIPRLGAPNPTLTAAALSAMVGEKIRSLSEI